MSGHPPFGRRKTIAILVGLVAIILLALIPRRATRDDWMHGNGGRCTSNLRQIGQAIYLYANAHRGSMPLDLATLCIAEELPGEMLVCRSSDDEPSAATQPAAFLADVAAGGRQTYVYVRRVDRSDALRADEVVAFEPIGHHPRPSGGPGMNVLRGDGKVEWVTGAAARAIIERHARGERPTEVTR